MIVLNLKNGEKMKKIFKIFNLNPYIQILLSFLVVLCFSAFLLMLPISSNSGKFSSIIDSIFTATSALCVTGLVVNDVSTYYTTFGKIIIIILIQLGGLGIITFSSMLALLISSKMKYYTKKLISEDINYDTLNDLPYYIKKVALVVFSIELIGAFMLFFQFITEMSFKKAIFFSIFHSISAFCNAGFSLFSNNLEGYTGNFIINIVITTLIILGGIGFAAILDIYNVKMKNRRKISHSTRIAISMTIFLIIIGTIFTFILEYSNVDTLASLSFKDKILSSYFQSVTMRTAGFQTINLSKIGIPTIMIYVFLMFIGASPGSTGGGIKTTTFSIILLGIYNAVIGRENIEYRKRRISWNSFNKACSIVFVSLIYIFLILFIMVIFDKSKGFLPLLFEAVSAFGTVGVSMGITADLSAVSKLVLIITMFIGRVGPLTILYSISMRKLKEGKYKYPEETILIG